MAVYTHNEIAVSGSPEWILLDAQITSISSGEVVLTNTDGTLTILTGSGICRHDGTSRIAFGRHDHGNRSNRCHTHADLRDDHRLHLCRDVFLDAPDDRIGSSRCGLGHSHRQRYSERLFRQRFLQGLRRQRYDERRRRCRYRALFRPLPQRRNRGRAVEQSRPSPATRRRERIRSSASRPWSARTRPPATTSRRPRPSTAASARSTFSKAGAATTASPAMAIRG